MLQIFRSLFDDPVADCCPAPPAPRRPQHHIIGRPDRPSSIVAANGFREKGNCDVGQQPQRRPGGSSASLCWPSSLESAPRLARARVGDHNGERGKDEARRIAANIAKPDLYARHAEATDVRLTETDAIMM